MWIRNGIAVIKMYSPNCSSVSIRVLMNEFDVTERTKKHAFRASALHVIYNQSQTDAL